MNLKLKRIEYNLSQAELANKIGTSQKSISNYEKGITTPDTETLKKLADLFHTTIDNLLDHKVSYYIDKSSLTQEQEELIDKIIQLTREQCLKIDAYIDGLLTAEEFKQINLNKIGNKYGK